jgi:hypothetical protein
VVVFLQKPTYSCQLLKIYNMMITGSDTVKFVKVIHLTIPKPYEDLNDAFTIYLEKTQSN